MGRRFCSSEVVGVIKRRVNGYFMKPCFVRDVDVCRESYFFESVLRSRNIFDVESFIFLAQ